MKQLLLVTGIVISALCWSSCAATRSSSDDADILKAPRKALTSRFTMLSVSARHQLNDNTDVRKFSSWIKSTGAELVAVQQILRSTDSRPGFDSYTELLKRLDMRGTFAKARYYKGWDSGNALFCIYPMHQSQSYMLPTGKGKIRRSMSFGVFELGLKPIAFASTELDDQDLSERVKQVYEILSIQKSMEEYPIIVAGDFGEASGGKAPAKMMERYICANDSSAETTGMEQHVYLPATGKLKVLSSKKVHYQELNLTGILVTVEVTQ